MKTCMRRPAADRVDKSLNSNWSFLWNHLQEFFFPSFHADSNEKWEAKTVSQDRLLVKSGCLREMISAKHSLLELQRDANLQQDEGILGKKVQTYVKYAKETTK